MNMFTLRGLKNAVATLFRCDGLYLLMCTAVLSTILVCVTILGGCSEKPTKGDRSFRVEGVVVEKLTSTAVDSAQVDAFISGTHERTVLTDSSGYFDLHFGGGSYIGNLRILVSKQSYVTFDTLIVRLDGNLTDWIIGLQKTQNVEKWEWRNSDGRDMSSEVFRRYPQKGRNNDSTKWID